MTERILDEDGISEELQHLLERDTETVTFPDRIYALGGGGRKMVLEMFCQDWVAIEAMRGRDQDIDIVFMDSASENKENHAEEVTDLKEHLYQLEQKIQEWTAPDVDVGGFTIQDELITDQISITNRASLTGSEPIDEIKKHTEADHWWVRNEHLDAVDERGDFYDVSQGAVKRRALGKALHYKALAQGDTRYEDAMQSNVEESQIAIFTGLGGGTGSGTVIDVARKIRDHNEGASIQLFATLPTSGQRDQAQANAFAALSELEYLNLSGETPFNNIYLFPLEPTELDSETTDNPELRELDRAMTYAVLGVYNATDLDYALSNTLSYSPFTIVVPQVLRYSRDEIKAKKDRIHQLLETKRGILNREYDNIERLGQHLDSFHPDVQPVSGTELSDEAREYIIRRIERFEHLLDSDLLKKLDIELSEDRESILGDIYGEDLDPSDATLPEVVRRRGLDEIIEDIEFNVDIEGIEDGRVDSYTEFGDDLIYDIAHTELARLVRVYEMLRRLQGAQAEILDSGQGEISTDADTKLLETLLVPSFGRGIRKKRFKALKTETEDLSQRVQDLEEELVDTEEQLSAERESFEEKVEQFTSEYWHELKPLVADYQQLADIQLDQATRQFTSALTEYATDLATESDVDSVSTAAVETALDELRQKANPTLQSEFGRENQPEFDELESAVMDTIETAKVARRAWDKLETEAGDNGFLGGFLDSNDDGALDTKRYRTVYEKVDGKGVFELPRPPNTDTALERTDFSVDVTVDLNKRLNTQIEQLRSDLVDELCNVYENVLEELENQGTGKKGFASQGSTESNRTDQFERKLRGEAPNRLEDQIRTILVETIEEELDTDIDEYQQSRNELEAQLQSLRARQNRIEAAFDLFENLTNEIGESIWDRYDTYDDEYHADVFDIPNQRMKRHTIDQLYQHDVTPADLSSAVKKQSLAQTDLLARSTSGKIPQEREDIRKSFSKITSNRVLDSRYNGLKRTRINTADVASFEETGVYVSYASEAINTSDMNDAGLATDDFDDVKRKLIKNLGINDDSNQYDQWFVNNGDPWEIAMCVYIQGLPFLDNLRDLTANDGYWSRYQELARGSEPSKTIERHGFGLERGYHVTRSELIDIDSRPNFFLEQSREEIQAELSECHERVDLQTDLEVEQEHERKNIDN